ncbi:hypothetical protein AK812_SmicGene42021 [Symbiodinium microadriaticum]|uniref:Uncharacterized protein n=1 Tax=Symbiodinium microadriaticum TaxID=2951 RepID=A0A1Q9C4M4_SYMMI|nr:hypothetical protein AK812_SmicGene42021 [Symbiodinium microadriaticum]
MINGRSSAEARCVQCRVPQTAGGAFYAEVLHRPVTVQGCTHGPFCARCRRSVSAQVLPFCVCRALVSAWREAAWPVTTLRGKESPTKPTVQIKATNGAAHQGASGNFVSWDDFPVSKPAQAANGHAHAPQSTNGSSKLLDPPATSKVEVAKRPLLPTGDEAEQRNTPQVRPQKPRPRDPGGPPSVLAFAAQAAANAKKRRKDSCSPGSDCACVAWEPLRRGSFRVLGSGWQVLIPARGSHGGSISGTATLTIQIQNKVFAGEDAELDGEEWHPFEAASAENTSVEASSTQVNPTAEPRPPPPPDLDGGAFEEPPPPPQVSSSVPSSMKEAMKELPPAPSSPGADVPRQLMDEHVRARMQWIGGKAGLPANHDAAGKRPKRSKEMFEVAPAALPTARAAQVEEDAAQHKEKVEPSPQAAHTSPVKLSDPVLDPKVAAAWGLPSLQSTAHCTAAQLPKVKLGSDAAESFRKDPSHKQRALKELKRPEDGELLKTKATRKNKKKKEKKKMKASKANDHTGDMFCSRNNSMLPAETKAHDWNLVSRTVAIIRLKLWREAMSSMCEGEQDAKVEWNYQDSWGTPITTLTTALADDVSDDPTQVAEESDDATQIADEDLEPTSPACPPSSPSDQMEEVRMAATVMKPQRRDGKMRGLFLEMDKLYR